MEKLAEADFRKILGAIEILGGDVDDQSFPRRVIDAIAAVLDADFVSYNEVDFTNGSSRFVLRPDPDDLDPASFEYAAFVRRFGNHPAIAQRLSARNESDPRLTQFVKRIRMLGMIGNCCGQAELRLNLGITVSGSPSRRIGVAVHRGVRDFDERDAARLDALRPHIANAYRSAVRARGAAIGPGPGAPGTPALTRRESEVLYWVSMGKTNEEVSRIVGAKQPTIKKQLEHIYDKLGVPNRTAAARAAGVPSREPATSA